VKTDALCLSTSLGRGSRSTHCLNIKYRGLNFCLLKDADKTIVHEEKGVLYNTVHYILHLSESTFQFLEMIILFVLNDVIGSSDLGNIS
jgi:hypothetical protein